MLFNKTYENPELKIEVEETDREVKVLWLGKSTAREPVHFIKPILDAVLKLARDTKKSIAMDFYKFEYMNSSTITPIIRALEFSNDDSIKISIKYCSSLKWQELNFSALEVFKFKNKNFSLEGIS